MQEIKLPRHDWFMGSMEQGGKPNRFTGSRRVDENSPALMSGSIHFEITVDKKEDESLVLKSHSWMLGRYPDFKKTLDETVEYDFTVEGIKQAETDLAVKYKEITRRDLLGIE